MMTVTSMSEYHDNINTLSIMVIKTMPSAVSDSEPNSDKCMERTMIQAYYDDTAVKMSCCTMMIQMNKDVDVSNSGMTTTLLMILSVTMNSDVM